MFEDGAKLDDIMNVLKPPALDNDDKKDRRNFDAAIRYKTNRSLGDDTVRFEFAGQKTTEVLR